MKKIKLYDYQQRMLEDIINVLTTGSTRTYYKKNGYEGEGKRFGDRADADGYGKDLRDGGGGEMVSG